MQLRGGGYMGDHHYLCSGAKSLTWIVQGHGRDGYCKVQNNKCLVTKNDINAMQLKQP